MNIKRSVVNIGRRWRLAFGYHKSYGGLFLLTLAVVFVVMLALKWWTREWTGIVETLLSFSTLIVAAVVWRDNAINEWINSLDKRLFVVFTYRGKEVFRCHGVRLAGEADIRGLAQQVGSQWASQLHKKGRALNFIPAMHLESGLVSGQGNAYIKAFVVTFQLRPGGDLDEAESAIQAKIQSAFDAGECYFWDLGTANPQPMAESISLNLLPASPVFREVD